MTRRRKSFDNALAVLTYQKDRRACRYSATYNASVLLLAPIAGRSICLNIISPWTVRQGSIE